MSEHLHVLDIAEIVLKDGNKPMHVNEIAMTAANKGLIVNLTLEEFTKKLNSSLLANTKTEKPKFTRVKSAKGVYRKGFYRLKRIIKQPDLFPTPEPTQSEDTGYIGKAGEMAVMAELLFRNFNVSMMMVDKGIDIVAANDVGKYFHIQVKTTGGRDGYYLFTIKRKAFDANNAGNTFYIFVIRNPNKSDFLILPNAILASYIALDVVRGSESLSLKVTYDSKTKKYSLNGRVDITVHVNKFAQIN